MIPDREVWVRHDGSQTRQVVPAFLLCMTAAKDWMVMIKKSRDFAEYVDPEETKATECT